MKLYIIVGKALSAGLKAAQAVHAAYLFSQEHPETFEDWYENSNNIVILEHDDVYTMSEMLEEHGLNLVKFYEPDLDDQMTAICVEPAGKRHLRGLELAS